MSVIILDHIKRITYNSKVSTIKNCAPLFYLPEGLHQLALSVRQKENDKDPRITFSILSTDPEEYFIACEFHWFAVSSVNYARLVGFVDVMSANGWMIEHLEDNDIKKTVNEHCTTYAKETLGPVYVWRNKVAAHFASSAPFTSDNIGTLQDSLLDPVGYFGSRYTAHAHTYAKGDEKSIIPEWSLTQVFEEISTRFFPERTIPKARDSDDINSP